MAYLRKSQVTGLSPRSIDLNTITTPAGARINGRITSHTLKMADTFTVVGDITISDNLILAKLSDDGDDLILTSDNVSDRTIEGSGSIEGSTIVRAPNVSLTGMTGTVGSAVTGTLGSGVTGGSGLDAVNPTNLTTGALPVGVTGGSGLTALNASNLSAGTVPDARMPNLTGDITTVEGAVATTIAASVIGVKPHIIPDVLYPSSGNDLAGDALVATTDGPNDSTVASSKYGTVQASDGRMYYYTDIKGSKPIKDPRIGAHFGSQRHKIKSRQLLEQETATHGENIYSFDGREFFRGQCPAGPTNSPIQENSSNGQCVFFTETSNFIEFTGYFNAVNLLHKVQNGTRTLDIYVDGLQAHTALSTAATVDAPLGGRYVDASSVQNIDITSSSSLSSDTTLGIHTFKAKWVAGNQYIHGIELIAQEGFTDATCDYNDDPTITHDDDNGAIRAGMSVTGTGILVGATVASVTSNTEFELSVSTTGGSVTNGTLNFAQSNIQIPSQKVVSYGKKFTVSGTPHYDPFKGFLNGTSLHSDYVDTATSLGLSTGTLHGDPWNKGEHTQYNLDGQNEIRPRNGGRVVKWVDSSGTIKTSVNMMPPNAQNSEGTAYKEMQSDSTGMPYVPSFSDDAVDHSLAEVAKTFHWREFGNGAANGGTGGTFADASMLDMNSDSIAYVMEDGLTSFSAVDCENPPWYPAYNSIQPSWDDDYWCFTFIGTGIHYQSDGAWQGGGNPEIQNLPYGTHILKVLRPSGGHPMAGGDITIDGVLLSDPIGTNYGFLRDELTIFQPKMPPIPEDAVVLADYMLMADFVPVFAEASGYPEYGRIIEGSISKGARAISTSRDVFCDVAGAIAHYGERRFGFDLHGTNMTVRLPMFATNYVQRGYQSDTRTELYRDSSTSLDSSATKDNTASYESYAHLPVEREYDWKLNEYNQYAWIRTGRHIQPLVLGLHNLGWNAVSGQNANSNRIEIATPTHTSSHYQTFETPFLHELVGGDRNMEQTNLVVTPDGKTWDEVTRDTSYIGNIVAVTNWADVNNSFSTGVGDEFRGTGPNVPYINYFTKDFAIAYDRLICLKDGQYQAYFQTHQNTDISSGGYCDLRVNGYNISRSYQHDATDATGPLINEMKVHLKRGDYVQIYSQHWNENLSHFDITRL